MLDYYRFKEINELFREGRQEQALHLLAEMQAKYIAVCDENAMLKMQVKEMEDILYLSKNLIFDGFCYWLITGNIKQGPFCRECYNREGALLRLDTQDDDWRCPVCGAQHERLMRRPPRPLARKAPQTAKILPFSG